MAEAKCKCGNSLMSFPRLKLEEIDGKWEGECCSAAPQAPKAQESQPKEEAKEEPKAEKAPEPKKSKSEDWQEKMKKVTNRAKKKAEGNEPEKL